MQNTINIKNKRARFDYEILDKFTAGIVLGGTEIKSIRLGKASLSQSFCEFNDSGELFVINISFEPFFERPWIGKNKHSTGQREKIV